MLMLGVLSVLDPRNRVPSFLIPFALFFFLAGITAALGWQTSEFITLDALAIV